MQFQVVAIAGRKFAGKDTAAQALVDEGYVNVKFATPLKLMIRTLLEARGATADEAERMTDGDLKEVVTPLLDFSNTGSSELQVLATAMLRVLLTYQGVSDYDAGVMLEGNAKDKATKYLQFRTPAYALETLAGLWLGKIMSAGPATSRYAMQTLGTEWGRDTMGEGQWVDAAVNCIEEIKKSGGKAVVSDMRFPNEGDAMDTIGALKLRVRRSGDPQQFNSFSNHPSETAIDDLSVHLDIDNDSTIEMLHGRVKLAAQNQKQVRLVETIDRSELEAMGGNLVTHPKLAGAYSVLSQYQDDATRKLKVEFLALRPILDLAA